ncbi:MAG: glutaredoxin family protein [Actinomycetes bacterium]
MKPRIKVLVKPGCHLCDEAIKVITEVSSELNESFEVVEIQDNPELMHQYAEEIPVTFVDDKQHDFWRVDKERLKKALLDV